MRDVGLHNICWVAAVLLVLAYALVGWAWAIPLAIVAGAVGELLEG